VKAKKLVVFSVVALSVALFLFSLAYVRVEDVDTTIQTLDTMDAEFSISQDITGLMLETDGDVSSTMVDESLETVCEGDVDITIQTLDTIDNSSIFVGSENLTNAEVLSSQNLTEGELSSHISFENSSLALQQLASNKSLAINLVTDGGASVSITVDGGMVAFEVEASGSGVLEAELEAGRYWVDASVDGQKESWSGSGHFEVWDEFLRSLLFEGELEDQTP